MIVGMTYYDILLYFLIYSVVGWIIEVAYHAVTLGKVINRGFLNGPVCPVYGFGILAIFAVMNALPFQAQTKGLEAVPAWAVFISGTILASAVELLAGWLLYRFFHARWWDYSDRRFNVHGFICLEFSLVWGLGTVLVVRVLHPFIQTTVDNLLPVNIGWILILIFSVIYIADFILSVLIVIGLNKKLDELNQLRSSMRVVSDAMSESIGEKTISTSQKIEHGMVQAALARAEIRDDIDDAVDNIHTMKDKALDAAMPRLQQIKDSVMRSRFFGSGRLLKAFPGMIHTKFAQELKELQDFLNIH